jgi:hypothetical protein
MNLLFIYPHTENLKDESVEKPIVHNEPPPYPYKGSEFIDDAIRMHDQPLMYTEVSVAAGSPDYFL